MYTRKMVLITERASELIPCIFGVFKNKIEGGGEWGRDRTKTIDLIIYPRL